MVSFGALTISCIYNTTISACHPAFEAISRQLETEDTLVANNFLAII